MSFPILDIYNKTAKIPNTLIEELRQKFLERVKKNPELYYPEDVERIKTDDWAVRRFLYRFKSEPDVYKGLEALDKAMKWRKSFGVRDLKDTDFAREGYLSAGIILYGKDLNGCQLIIMRGKVAKKSKTWRQHMEKIVVYTLEQADLKNKGEGLTILTDCTDTGIKNVDMDGMKFFHTAVDEYYPGLVNATVVYKMPAVLEAFYKLFRSWLNEEQNKYMYLTDKKNINNYVSVDQLPDFLMGTNTQPYRNVPEGATTIHDLALKYGIKKEKADKLLKHFEKFYET